MPGSWGNISSFGGKSADYSEVYRKSNVLRVILAENTNIYATRAHYRLLLLLFK